MKICAAQTRPFKGDIARNIDAHKRFIQLAAEQKADIIIFPELSITGYEPLLAKELSTGFDDKRLDDLQALSDSHAMTVCIGMPLKSKEAVQISMVIFQPHQPRQVYSKQYLHEDEFPYFARGNKQVYITNKQHKIAPAICYELSVPAHAATANNDGATIYLASVAKTADGMTKAVNSLSAIARNYSMPVLIANCVGHCDNFDCGGRSSAWNNKGVLSGQLDETSEGMLIFDTGTQQLVTEHFFSK